MLVERHQQLDLMAAAARRAGEGHGAVVLVSGEAGIGKTSLVTAFLDTLTGVPVIWGACDDLATPRTFGPLHDMARSHPALAAALGEGSHTGVQEALLSALAPATGLAVGVIEDAHWADQATVDAVRYVGRRIAVGRGLLVVTARTEAIVGDHPLRLAFGGLPPSSVERIELAPLSREGVEALAGSAPVDEVLAITGGNPFFVTELLDSGLEMPRSVVDSVLARAAGLGPPTRELLAVVAVVPGETDRELLAAVHPEPEPAIAEAEGAGLVVSGPTTVRFRHELARRAYEAALGGEARRRANRAVLTELERRAAAPARLVHHAEQSADVGALARWAPVAAREAVTANAHREAVDHLRRANAMLDRYPREEAASLLELLAWECYVVGRIDEAVRHAERAVELRVGLSDPVGLGNAYRLLSRVAWMHGRRRQAEANAELSIASLEPLGESRDLAFAYSTRSQLAMLAGDDEAAVEWGTVAVDMARRLDDARILSHALNNVGTAIAHRGDLEEGLELIVEARELALAGGFDEDAVRAWTNQVWALYWAQRFAAAEALVETAIGYSHDTQQDGFEMYLVATRALLRLDTGELAGAERDARWALAQPAGRATSGFPALSTLGTVLARRGSFAEARASLDTGWERALANTELQRTFPMALAIAELAWIEGRPEEGLYGLDTIAAEVARAGTVGNRCEAAFWRARAGLGSAPPPDAPDPYRHWFAGDHRAASSAWMQVGARHRAADVLFESDSPVDLEWAIAEMTAMGADAVAARFAQRAAEVRASARRVVTVLFTDIVGSTELAGRLGDSAWRALLDRHDTLTTQAVGRHGGRVVKGTGDGVMASFDSPSAGIDAAAELVGLLEGIGVAVRAGLHTGEVVVRGEDLGGAAVHLAARVGAVAAAGQVVVSSTTRDLVAGGGRVFSDLGPHRLKGLDDEWRLYALDR